MPHIHKVYDFVVTPIIVFGDKVLFVHHPKYDMWIPPGGHIELDEDPDEALMREIKEETGMDVEVLSNKPKTKIGDRKILYTPNFLDVHYANPPHRHISLVYVCRAKNDGFTKSDEHNELRWLSKAELEDPNYKLDDGLIFYAKQALKLAHQTP